MKARWLGLAAVVAALVLTAGGWRIAARPQATLDDFPLASCSDTDVQAARPDGRVFHVDPQRGSANGDGSAARPWRDLQQLADAGLLGEMRRELRASDRLFAALAHTVPTVRSRVRETAVIRPGDTVLLASGAYGTLDLSGLANRGFVTIAAARGAKARFAEIDLSGASHFVLRGIAVHGAAPSRGTRLVNTYAPGPLRADNLLFDDIEIFSDLPIATTKPDVFSDRAPDGLMLAGDCLAVTGSNLHDLESAVNVFRGRKVTVANNTIRDFSVDGVQFSGQDIFIRDNVITDQWPTPDPLHPDCMQGQPPDGQMFGPVTISGNLCVRAFASASREQFDAAGPIDRFGLHGIGIFNGRWQGVTIRCNLLLPGAQHGLAVYGISGALIEHNVVAGLTEGEPSWIAAMPLQDVSQSVDVLIRGNRATAYLNAVQNGPRSIEDMIDIIRVRRRDADLVATLRKPITGVTLRDNVLLIPQDGRETAPPDDTRFARQPLAKWERPRDAREVRELHALPEACNTPA